MSAMGRKRTSRLALQARMALFGQLLFPSAKTSLSVWRLLVSNAYVVSA